VIGQGSIRQDEAVPPRLTAEIRERREQAISAPSSPAIDMSIAAVAVVVSAVVIATTTAVAVVISVVMSERAPATKAC
jgi:hypothetical protein